MDFAAVLYRGVDVSNDLSVVLREVRELALA